jgi:hypothetical protein
MYLRSAASSLCLASLLVAMSAFSVIAATQPAQAAPMPLLQAQGAAPTPSVRHLRQLVADVQGSYTLADGRSLVVSRSGSGFLAEIAGAAPVRLAAAGPRRLRSEDGQLTLEFHGSAGEPALRVSLITAP